MSVPTLYGISAELLNLMEARETLLGDAALTDATRALALKEVETAIREQVSALVRKVDGAAFYLREFTTRAAAAKAEKERNREREHMWEARGERLKEYIIAVMQMMGKTRLDGDSNTLRLQKCPPSVEIAQPELVPEEMQKVSITMPLVAWRALCADLKLWPELANELERAATKAEPMKAKIGEALKQQIPCGRCDGTGIVTIPAELRIPEDNFKSHEKCAQCAGTGKVNQGVPGCSLVTDKMSLRVE